VVGSVQLAHAAAKAKRVQGRVDQC